MDKRPKKKKVKMILVLTALALVCVGAVELAACRYFAPELYQRITGPVSDAAAATASFIASGYDRARAYLAELLERKAEAEPEVLPDDQRASQPILEYVWDPGDEVVTTLTTQNGRQVLTGGSVDVVYYNQGDDQWAEEAYGTDKIGGYGCGPTAMAMVVASMTDQEMDPAKMAQWAVDNGCWARKRGSYLSIVPEAGEDFGLQVASFSPSGPDGLRLELATGNILVALMGPGHFTESGHFIILRGVSLDGGILVADPNSSERSLTAWDAQLILDELSQNTGAGGPLWTISPYGDQ